MSSVDTLATAGGRRGARRAATRLDPVLVGCGLVLVLAAVAAVAGPALAPQDPDAAALGNAFVGPVAGHPLGFDGQGRDLLSRLLAGARSSLVGPTAVTLAAVLAGTVLATASAWWGGTVDAVLGAVTDILFAFPAILLAVLAAAVFGAGLTAPCVALAVAYTPYVARVLRSAAVRERAREYIAASEVQGLGAVTICVRHLLPNLGGLITAQATLLFGYAMVDLAAISYIGLGVQQPQADWGVMVSTGQSGVLQGYPAESLSAGLCIVVVVVCVNLAGERLAQRSGGRR